MVNIYDISRAGRSFLDYFLEKTGDISERAVEEKVVKEVGKKVVERTAGEAIFRHASNKLAANPNASKALSAVTGESTLLGARTAHIGRATGRVSAVVTNKMGSLLAGKLAGEVVGSSLKGMTRGVPLAGVAMTAGFAYAELNNGKIDQRLDHAAVVSRFLKKTQGRDVAVNAVTDADVRAYAEVNPIVAEEMKQNTVGVIVDLYSDPLNPVSRLTIPAYAAYQAYMGPPAHEVLAQIREEYASGAEVGIGSIIGLVAASGLPIGDMDLENLNEMQVDSIREVAAEFADRINRTGNLSAGDLLEVVGEGHFAKGVEKVMHRQLLEYAQSQENCDGVLEQNGQKMDAIIAQAQGIDMNWKQDIVCEAEPQQCGPVDLAAIQQQMQGFSDGCDEVENAPVIATTAPNSNPSSLQEGRC
ncbi:MAG: hypothetical protein P8P30_06310 [Rickettsiales bacterium]|nr:hypothetical protein [Rickettsiales bacterium]